jgi:sortase A
MCAYQRRVTPGYSFALVVAIDMRKPQSRNSRIRRWIEDFLLIAGVAGVSLWAASIVVPAIWQDWGNWVFDHELRGETATLQGYMAGKVDDITRDVESWLGVIPVAKVSVPNSAGPRTAGPRVQRPSIAPNGLIGRITIPRLHLSAIVREGVGKDTLGLAVGHIPGTSLPGQDGNVGVAGHRDTLFLGLKGIKANDLVQFETLDGSYVYQVKSTEIVKPRDVSVLNASRYSELTLVTCYPFNFIGPAPDRFIIKAREVSQSPSPEGLSGQEVLRPDVEATSLAQDGAPQDVAETARNEPARAQPGRTQKVSFDVGRNQSRALAPGISLGIDDLDVTGQRVNGWMLIMPDRRTIWLRDQRTQDPVIFYSDHDSTRRELLITKVTSSSASGYLLLSEE